MGLFDFIEMFDNYEGRKVDRYENKDLVIDTCSVSDSDNPYETGIKHPLYNDNEWVIVETYKNREKAQEGHNKWVKIMTDKILPPHLWDMGSAEVTKLLDTFAEDEWRKKDKEE